MSVDIKLCSEDERDPCVVGDEIKVSACPNLEVVEDRDRMETRAVASRIPIKAALEETRGWAATTLFWSRVWGRGLIKVP